MKYALTAVAMSLIIAFAWLPFELKECDKLLVEHGVTYFCVPVGFIAIPLLCALLIIIGIYLLFVRKNYRKR